VRLERCCEPGCNEWVTGRKDVCLKHFLRAWRASMSEVEREAYAQRQRDRRIAKRLGEVEAMEVARSARGSW